jgi:regulatory protein
LTARGFGADEVEEACRRLEESGLLNDLECAKQMIEGPWRRKGYGGTRIRAELERRGVDGAVIEEALGESLGDERAMAEEAARRWLRRSRCNRDSLARHLARKGYGSGTVLQVVRLLDDEAAFDDSDSDRLRKTNEEQ